MNKRTFAKLICQLVTEMFAAGDECILFCTGRTQEVQHALFLVGKSKCNGITNRSRHQDLLAADIYLADDNGIIWGWDPVKAERWHKRWMELSGGTDWLDWDPCHFSSDGK